MGKFKGLHSKRLLPNSPILDTVKMLASDRDAIMMSVIMMSVIMPSVVAPWHIL